MRHLPRHAFVFFLFATLTAFSASAEPKKAEISWRTGALLSENRAFLTLGVGLRLHVDPVWAVEASADFAMTEGTPFPTDIAGFFDAVPLSLTWLYRPIPSWSLSPFLAVGGGLNLLTDAEPVPFLLGGGGASYRNGIWGVTTDLRFLFLPGSNASDLLDERGLQMTFSIQREL